MRLGVVCVRYFSEEANPEHGESGIGGAERYATRLAAALSKHLPTDLISARMVGRGAVDLSFVDASTSAVTERARFSLLDAAQMLIRRYRLLQFMMGNELTVACGVMGRLTRRCDVWLSPVGGGSALGFGRLHLSEIFRGFLPISVYACEQYRWLQTTKRPVSIIYGGGDPALPNDHLAGTEGATERTCTGDDAPVLCVGRLVSYKGVDVLLKALPPDVKALIVGPHTDREYLRHCQGISRSRRLDVEFVGPVGERELRLLYREARVTVLPSVYVDYLGRRFPRPELLGLAVLESMWEGTPVLASGEGPMQELIEPTYGHLFPPGDVTALRAALETYRDPGLVRERGGAAAGAARSRFTWDLVAARALDTYSLA